MTKDQAYLDWSIPQSDNDFLWKSFSAITKEFYPEVKFSRHSSWRGFENGVPMILWYVDGSFKDKPFSAAILSSNTHISKEDEEKLFLSVHLQLQYIIHHP